MADSSVRGKSYIQLYNQFEQYKREGKDNTNSKGAAKVYKAMISKPEHQIVGSLRNQLIELDRQIDELTPLLSLTDEEKDAFFQKAIQDIEPWYQEKVAEIEAGVEEGKVRTAEDTLLLIRDVEQEIGALFQKYDLSQAETEEEFVDQISALTARTEDDIEAKRIEWTQRMENIKLDQIGRGIFSSGIGKKRRALAEQARSGEISDIQERSQEQRTALAREKDYSLDQIRLARQAAEQDRIRRIGTPEETAETRVAARETLGLQPGQELGSAVDIQAGRVDRGITPIFSGGAQALRDLEEQKGTRVLSRSKEFEEDELARRDTTYGAQIDKILAEQAAKRRQLQGIGFTA